MSRGLIYLNSLDRQPFEDEQKIRYDVNLQDDINGIALSSFDFIYGFCNINSKSRSGFLATGSQSFQVDLEPGQYNYSELLAEMSSKLNGIGIGPFIVRFQNGVYIIEAPIAVKFINNPFGVGRDWVDMANIQKETIEKIEHIGGTANLAYTNAIYILSDELHKRRTIYDTSSNKNISNVLGVVYINKDANLAPSNVKDEVVEPKHITERLERLKWINKDVNNSFSVITIRLVDERGFELPKRTDGCGSVEYTLELQTKMNDQSF